MGYAYDYIAKDDPQLRAFVTYAVMALKQNGLQVKAVENPAPLPIPGPEGELPATISTTLENSRGWRYRNEDEIWMQVTDPKTGRSVHMSFNGHAMLADGYMPTGSEYTIKLLEGNRISGEYTIANAPFGTQVGDNLRSYESHIPDDIDGLSRATAIAFGGNGDPDMYAAMQGPAYDKTQQLAQAVKRYLEGLIQTLQIEDAPAQVPAAPLLSNE